MLNQLGQKGMYYCAQIKKRHTVRNTHNNLKYHARNGRLLLSDLAVETK